MSQQCIDFKTVGAGDCAYVKSILCPDEQDLMFYLIKNEIKWGTMKHQGQDVPRLICIQSEIINVDGKTSMPLYRHPVDQHPPQIEFTPFVQILKNRAEDVLGFPRNYFNHCLVQYYPDSKSHINDHSDKTLDIRPGTQIINISLGAVRHMRIKNKTKNSHGIRESVKFPMENGSVFSMGLQTNKEFYHGIHQDLRPEKTKSPDELAFNGGRISLTFRNIGTFIDQNNNIYGQGAKKTFEIDYCPKIDALKMLRAFGNENHDNNFDWNINYGDGFNSIGLEIIDR